MRRELIRLLENSSRSFRGFRPMSNVVNGDDTCTVPMDQARSVTAGFDLQRFNLTVSVSGSRGGTVMSDPEGIDCGSNFYLHGDDDGRPIRQRTLPRTPRNHHGTADDSIDTDSISMGRVQRPAPTGYHEHDGLARSVSTAPVILIVVAVADFDVRKHSI